MTPNQENQQAVLPWPWAGVHPLRRITTPFAWGQTMLQTQKDIMIPIKQSNLRHLSPKKKAWKQVALLVRVQANPWAPEAPCDLATSPPKPDEDVKTRGPLTGIWGKPALQSHWFYLNYHIFYSKITNISRFIFQFIHHYAVVWWIYRTSTRI